MQFLGQSPKGRCKTCGKDIIVRSTRGDDSTGYCSRVCASMKRFEKRYTGPRSQQFANPADIERKRYE